MFTFFRLLRAFKKTPNLNLKFSRKCYVEVTHQKETLDSNVCLMQNPPLYLQGGQGHVRQHRTPSDE